MDSGWADEVTEVAMLAVLRLCPPANRQDMRRAVRLRAVAERFGNLKLAQAEDTSEAMRECDVALRLALAISTR